MKDYIETASAATSGSARNNYVDLKALLYAIGCIQSLPAHRQERSDMIDMCSMVRRVEDNGRGTPLLPNLLWSVEHHIGHKIDLWPAHGGDGPGGTYSDVEMDRRDTVRAWIDDREAQFLETQAAKDAPPSGVVKFIDGDDLNEEGEVA